MTEYSNFTIDFVNRTKDILANYKGEYETTNLINCCLGLIILPTQNIGNKIPSYTFDEKDSFYGITAKNITYEKNNDLTLSKTLRHIRNGLAHGRIDQKASRKKIVGLRIHDKRDEDSEENFVIEFTTEEFKNFAVAVSKIIEL